ncbi:ABC transporter permease subunit [Nonomuraea sp. NPDC049625]|uniref:ABC transporter permease subunit n=1 Tax=Nonomuraea sp. NPDC049625 TaxID=3155775 RepID=UPI00342EC624
MVALGAFFPVYLNTYSGIRNIDERLVEAARTCGLPAAARLRHVVLPGALPSLFLGLLSDLALRTAERRALAWRRGPKAS